MLMFLWGAIWGIGIGMGVGFMSLVDWWIDHRNARREP